MWNAFVYCICVKFIIVIGVLIYLRIKKLFASYVEFTHQQMHFY
jgi:hypothetical protein